VDLPFVGALLMKVRADVRRVFLCGGWIVPSQGRWLHSCNACSQRKGDAMSKEKERNGQLLKEKEALQERVEEL